jgi:hypothetical protein
VGEREIKLPRGTKEPGGGRARFTEVGRGGGGILDLVGQISTAKRQLYSQYSIYQPKNALNTTKYKS